MVFLNFMLEKTSKTGIKLSLKAIKNQYVCFIKYNQSQERKIGEFEMFSINAEENKNEKMKEIMRL